MFDTKSHIYFIGIGGIGMSALARYFKSQGKNVGGYDKTSTPLTNELEAVGIEIHFNDDLKSAQKFSGDLSMKENVLVVYTPAIPTDHSELIYFKENN